MTHDAGDADAVTSSGIVAHKSKRHLSDMRRLCRPKSYVLSHKGRRVLYPIDVDSWRNLRNETRFGCRACLSTIKRIHALL